MQRVTPTRQEMLRLKKRLKTAKTGHRLLEDKLESLMKEFLERISKLKKLRKNLAENLPEAFSDFFMARSLMGPEATHIALSAIPELKLETESRNIMGVNVTDYKAKNADEVESSRYGKLFSNEYLDSAEEKFSKIFGGLIEYAVLEQEVRSIGAEIETTRKRVNALEHILIPDLEKSLKYVSQKLEEADRTSRIVMMKVKAQIEG